MKAIVFKDYGDVDQLSIQNVDKPTPKNEEVLIQVKAFGINRAETMMRKGLWGDVSKISGIECVGIVEFDPSGMLAKGQTVAAIMGGMGRVRNGSYAEYTCIAASNVFVLNTSLDWHELAAIPESYATAWACLHDNMHLQNDETVFIRGGTSALALAAINIASNIAGVTVYASTRSENNIHILENAGCSSVFIEDNNLSTQVRTIHSNGINSVLDLIGNTTLLDSLKMVKKDGYVCNAGFLGGGNAIQFNPPANLPPAVNLNFFGSFMFGTEHYPLSEIPLQTIIEKVSSGAYQAKPAKIFNFEDIAHAHLAMENNEACGKIVVQI